MEPSIVYSEEYEIVGRLAQFGCSVGELQDAAFAAVSARNEATPLHPVNAPGTFSYMEGVAAIRMIFLQIDGWEKHCCKGVEGVQNKDFGLVVLFQNVDVACGIHDPSPISQKGDAVRDLVDNPTGYLWQHMADEAKASENSEVWFLCVSSNGDEVRAELSMPREIKNGNFGTLSERIFIIKDDNWPPRRAEDDSEHQRDEDDLDIPVSKKK